jgi:putative N6-adenine-specific DNA methylase
MKMMDKTGGSPFTGLMASCAFGLEGLLAQELRGLGMQDVTASDARVNFAGGMAEAMRANMHLRTADRVYLVVGQFTALTFDELFEGVRALPWTEVLGRDDAFPVKGKSVKSALFSVSDCQSIAKKAIVENLKAKYRQERFAETGPEMTIDVALLRDTATISLDTSGAGLNRRGYRAKAVEAPLRENLAAGLVMLSGWRYDTPLMDPFCGSGTIAIEAAMMGKNVAPGLLRSFAMEQWRTADKQAWAREREAAKAAVRQQDPDIRASDIDPEAVAIARENAKRAGMGFIRFSVNPVALAKAEGTGGTIVCNPPYGERTGDLKQVHKACRGLGVLYEESDGWWCCALTAFPEFERWFGKRAERKRKLYNGNMRCEFFQYRPKQKA